MFEVLHLLIESYRAAELATIPPYIFSVKLTSQAYLNPRLTKHHVLIVLMMEGRVQSTSLLVIGVTALATLITVSSLSWSLAFICSQYTAFLFLSATGMSASCAAVEERLMSVVQDLFVRAIGAEL